MSHAVVYFSKSGNARFVAEELALRLEARLVELKETRRRRGPIGFFIGGFQAATRKSSTLLGEPWKEVRDAQTVYLITPIWASNTTPAMNAFLDHADFSGKRVHIVTLQADPDAKGSDKAQEYVAQQVRKKGGTVAGSYALESAVPGRFAGQEKLHKQVERVVQSA